MNSEYSLSANITIHFNYLSLLDHLEKEDLLILESLVQLSGPVELLLFLKKMRILKSIKVDCQKV